MAKVERLEKVLSALQQQSRKYGTQKRVSVVVGYSAFYAIWVHENLEARHTNGSAKFLEQPAGEKAGEIATIVRESAKKGLSLEQSLLMGGLFLQREAQLLTPVLTGNLKGSAFTRSES